MHRICLSCFAPVCLLLTSCTYVACKAPVGEKAKAEIAEKLNGTWRIEDGVVYVKYIGDGNVLVAGVKEDKKEFKLTQQTVIVTTIGDEMYLNLPMPEEKPDRYMLMRLAGGGKAPLVMYGPKSQPFAEAVRTGKLKGEIDGPVPQPARGSEADAKSSRERRQGRSLGEGVVIDDRAALEEFIRKQPTSALFDVERPLVFTRIGEPKDKEKEKEKELKKK